MLKAGKKSSDRWKNRNAIEKLFREVETCKRIIKKKLKNDPDNLSAHRMYCAYVRSILEIQKTMIQARLTDRESLLLAALKSVVQTLIEKGESPSAEIVGNYLEDIGEKVRTQWQEPQGPGRAMMKSERSSKLRSPPSVTIPRGKNKTASNAP